jgi:ferredoxin-NADP reductase
MSLKDQLDFWLSKVTMYRLVTICLIALLGAAGLLSLTGYFAFSFVELLASITVLLVSVYASGRLFGWLFGVRPHGESSIITALILVCLFIPPELTLLGLTKIALVGLFASATKYIIAVHGRHIFNPAASAAVIASVAGVAFAGWWVATPALLPVTITIGLLILYKTRRLQMGLVFVLLASLLVIAQSIANDLSLGQAVWFAFASWPTVFFAGVMLSEPLTQPPRRWQQLTIAAGVAVIMVIPLRSEFISMTPALALVIGNGVAFLWGVRRALRLKFVEKIKLTPSTYEFVFESKVPFTPGQYLEFSLPHKNVDSRGVRRVFTIATTPKDEKIRFGIKMYERPSTFKQTLLKLKPGTIVPATRVAGDFVLPDEVKQPILFVAGGIGITPLISFARHLKARSENRDIVLIYSVSSAEEIVYQDVLVKCGIKVIIVTSDSKVKVPNGWKVREGFVTAELLAREVKDIQQRTVYVSGPPLMVNAVARAARKLGVPKVMTDHFAGY